MHYYTVSLLSSPLSFLTYSSEKELEPGMQVRIPLQRRESLGCIMEQVEKPAFKTQPIIESTGFCYSAFQRETAAFMAEYYFCSHGEALSLFVPFSQEVKAVPVDTAIVPTITLSEKQESALAMLQREPVSLLFGDTGAGKTEIYMKWFEQMIAQGKRSIFLMPEISLTPQMQVRLEKHFGDRVVMWHSKLTKKQKEKNLERIYNGMADIIAGPRSTLFLPIEELGLIVVDEEHDESYKASNRPRYHARDMAIYMASKLGINVLLGSATPSLTSYTKFPHYRLKGGHFAAQRRFLFEEHTEAITPRLEQEVKAVKQRGEQAMLFIPTRANFKYLICDSCGFTYECPYCSVGMSLHRNARAVKCHYCNYAESIPQRCPKCHNGQLISSRLGTAEAVEHFSEHAKELNVAQFDRDAITTQKKLKEALKKFNEGEIDLLIGTQMLSKGHDYHDVTFAAVLGLDNLLNMSDYRAREKALSLLIQIAGRSGRKKEASVLVQTFNAEFFKAYLGKYEQFLEEEKLFREGMYPPYKKLARVLFAHKNGIKAQEAMQQMAESLKRFEGVQVVGSGASPIEKIAGKYRFQILLRADRSTDLIRAIKASKTELAEVDMDPVEFA